MGMLDYRCHVPEGQIGTAFPPAVERCMRSFAEATPEQLRLQYLIPRHDEVLTRAGSHRQSTECVWVSRLFAIAS